MNLAPILLLLAASTALSAAEGTATKTEPLSLGSRRELFVDDYLIARMDRGTLKMHKPEAQDVALVCDAPWEGNTSGYFTLFQDGDVFRAYYRGTHYDEATKKGTHTEAACLVTWSGGGGLGAVPSADLSGCIIRIHLENAEVFSCTLVP